ncbi:uncharacterized protein [Physcomitrium patens]|uniref:uncharacterized protein isoform X1 n=1 Tax=Physcomitrium patens TaxID=3218 RepID=UPI003CCCFF79
MHMRYWSHSSFPSPPLTTSLPPSLPRPPCLRPPPSHPHFPLKPLARPPALRYVLLQRGLRQGTQTKAKHSKGLSEMRRVVVVVQDEAEVAAAMVAVIPGMDSLLSSLSSSSNIHISWTNAPAAAAYTSRWMNNCLSS